MDIAPLQNAWTTLDEDSVLRIDDGQGRTLLVLEGLVWITQSGDYRDVFAGRGESFTVERPGLTLVQALEPTRLLVLADS